MIAVSAAEGTRWPGHWAPDDYPFMQFMMNKTLKQANEKLFMRAKIGNLTFDGLDSPLLHMGDLGGDIAAAFNASTPYDRFGWFYSVSKLCIYFNKSPKPVTKASFNVQCLVVNQYAF